MLPTFSKRLQKGDALKRGKGRKGKLQKLPRERERTKEKDRTASNPASNTLNPPASGKK